QVAVTLLSDSESNLHTEEEKEKFPSPTSRTDREGSFVPTWAVFWPCLPIRAIRTGLSPRILFLLAGTHILPTGTVHHAGRGKMGAYPTLAVFTPSTGTAKDAPALIGEMDSSGSLNAHALLHLTERVRARTVFQSQQSQFVTWQFETEYRGSDFTAAVTVANPDILRESGMINSRCIIGGVLEKRLTPLPATLIMGAFVNHRGDKLQVGLGVNVG
ncbi:hypothetical protein GOODEAATRI_009201, partial [Goodea atripinnis]